VVAHALQDLESVGIGQGHVEEHEVGKRRLVEAGVDLLPVAREAGEESRLGHHLAHELQQVAVVLDHEDGMAVAAAGRHAPAARMARHGDVEAGLGELGAPGARLLLRARDLLRRRGRCRLGQRLREVEFVFAHVAAFSASCFFFCPMRLSSPRTSLAMFVWWRATSSTLMPATAASTGPAPRICQVASGAKRAATIAPREEYRVAATTAIQATSTARPSCPLKARSTPAAVATPLPPRKRSQ